MVHLTTTIGATFLRQRSAQKETVELSVGKTKRPQVEFIAKDVATDPLAEDVPIDPTVAVLDDDEVVDVDADVAGTSTPSLSLRDMMETFMITRQLMDNC